VAALAQDFSRQVFPDAPITIVKGLALSKGVEGMLMPHPSGSGEWGIAYNETIRSPGRRNFTLAHELGHYLLHRQANPRGLQCTNRNMADWDEARNRIEGEANTFASYLLMPLDDFRTQIKGRSIDIDVMTELADRYAVSLTAAILKWMTITDKRAMIVVGKEGFIDWAWFQRTAVKVRGFLPGAARGDRIAASFSGGAGGGRGYGPSRPSPPGRCLGRFRAGA
jgi:hypothetical protein